MTITSDHAHLSTAQALDHLNVVSLFSGIGGLELGLERAGMTVVGQVEIDPYCRQVLSTHWPEVPRHDDVRTAVDWWLSRSRPRVHVVAGGFPCQPFSTNGLRLGTADPRWLWPAMADFIAAVRPDWVVWENVSGLLTRGLEHVHADLVRLGYRHRVGWTTACAVAAPHMRRRLFGVAHTTGHHGELEVHVPAPVPGGRAHAGTTRGQARRDGWLPEPAVGRVAHGLPKRLVAPALRALGNAVVPTVAEDIGRLITASHTPERRTRA